MPQLTVYRSNHVEVLARVLADVLQRGRPADPFEPLEVVVGSRGMERWLRHKLAEELTICSNVRFPFPSAWLDAVLETVLEGHDSGARPALDPWQPDTLTWALLEELPDLVEQEPGAEAVKGYLQSWSGPVDAKGFGLARQLAGVLDRYVAYRPELARAWSTGQREPDPTTVGDLGWQRSLWRRLATRLHGAEHRAQRLAAAVAALGRGEAIPGLRALRLFAVTSLPPTWFELMGALTQHVPVDLFLLCPSDTFWADTVRPAVRRDPTSWRDLEREQVADALFSPNGPELHPLLASLGRAPRDQQIVLESQPADYEDARFDLFLEARAAEAPQPEADGSPPTAGNFRDPAAGAHPSALQRLQSDLLAARLPERPHALAPGDDSIQLHSCFGPVRQVEVLRDVLLGLLEDHPQLEPRDVLVMTPDIEAYAPLITAVFSQGAPARRKRDGRTLRGPEGWGPAGAPRVPCVVMDRSVRRTNPVAEALLRTLELAQGRFELSAVLDLLALEPVQRRLEVGPDEVATLQGWLRQAGVRWGRDAVQRREAELPVDPQNTWRFGLRRLLLGVVMASEGDGVQGVDAAGGATWVRPFDAMEGGETALLGTLVDLVNTLFEVADSLQEPRPVAQWVPALLEIVERLTATSAAAAWLARSVRDAVVGLGAAAEAAGSRREVTLETLRAALADRFELASPITREHSGAVTFGALKPMRCVPYKVVCLLGMDEGTFPRRSAALDFDLTSRSPRVGDSDPRDEDRAMLLEALLAARQHLLVLYSGHDPRSNEPQPPCVPIAELTVVLRASFAPPPEDRAADAVGWFTAHHPLQPFSPDNFRPRHRAPTPGDPPRPLSFDRRLCAGAKAARLQRRAPAGLFPPGSVAAQTPPGTRSAGSARLEEIPLADLVRFFCGPTRHLLQKRLRVNLSEHDDAVQDREPLELDTLQQWGLRRSLLEEAQAGWDLPAVRTRLRAEGTLPLGYAGEALLQWEDALVRAALDGTGLWPEGTAHPRAPDAPISLDVRVGGARITGTLDSVYGGTLLSLDFGSEDSRRWARLWIPLLVWHATTPDAGRGVLAMARMSQGVPAVTLLGQPAPQDASAQLATLVDIYQQGCRRPIPLFPKASFTLAKALMGAAATADLALLDAGLPDDPAVERPLSEAHQKALDAWFGGFRSRGDVEDPYIARVFDGPCPLSDPAQAPVPLDLEFGRLALATWGPLLLGRQTGRAAGAWLKEALA